MWWYARRVNLVAKFKVSAASLHCRPPRLSSGAGAGPPSAEWRRFSVDPQITTFEALQNLLAEAFDIKGEFTIHYLAKDDEGKETYLGLLSDWDLDAAFLSSSHPCLSLLVDLKPFEEGLEEWDIIAPADISKPPLTASHVRNNAQLTGNFLMQQMEKTLKTFSKFQKVLALAPDAVLNGVSDRYKPSKPPMNMRELQNFLDSDDRLVHPQELRKSIFRGGVEPGLRKVVWQHILNVYPDNLTGDQRIQYMKHKANEYYTLRSTWVDMQKRGVVNEEMQYVINLVSKDVLRTDRTHRFYAGGDDNKNVAKLFRILTTFALNHPSVSYCQGMSDLASPLLVTMNNEAHAYICFTALMQRLKPNFNINGLAITEKFAHLSLLLQHYDPEFFDYLKSNGADDLLYCYRWLLLELKREFSFDDALCMLEVLWSSLPPMPPDGELALFEINFGQDTKSPQSPRVHSRENPYTKVRQIRKQSSSSSLLCGTPKVQNGVIVENGSRRSSITEATDDSQDYNPISDPITNELRMDLQNLSKSVLLGPTGSTINKQATDSQHFTFDNIVEERTTLIENEGLWKMRKQTHAYCGTPDEQCDLDFYSVDGDILGNGSTQRTLSCQNSLDRRRSGSSTSASTSASSHSDPLLHEEKGEDSDYEDDTIVYRPKKPFASSEGYCSEATLSSKEVSCQEDTRSVLDLGVLEFSQKSSRPLPPPSQLGGGNPFMMFLCLTLLLQQRDTIIRSGMDYNELAMHFDKMIRKHNVHKVLHETRIRFEEYIRMNWDNSIEEHV
ncbi:TBC1 domain family member 25-like isoform X2 [Varroa destructor]|uniref:Rab-GAP TBC domain-containing protein n=1 Tax=Varroa destructor TaxID=109461 RepID=A0A7M7J1U8_VARDE|nr:TBC1 domain family member 25-like isoform X2 [Varroa destructor]